MKVQVVKKSGIYQIINLINGKVYIGSACVLERREQQHFRHLRGDKHHSTSFQRAFNKYGESNFKFEILELVEDKSQLIKREQHYLDTLLFAQEFITTKGKDKRFYKLGYNTNPVASSRLGAIVSIETRLKKSLSRLGATNITCRKPIIQLDLDGNFIREYESISAASKELKVSITGITVACTGKTKTCRNSFWLYKDIYISKIYTLPSLVSRNTGSTKPSCCKPVLQLNKLTRVFIAEYRSIQEASRKTGTFEISISKNCKGIIKSANGFKWEFKIAA